MPKKNNKLEHDSVKITVDIPWLPKGQSRAKSTKADTLSVEALLEKMSKPGSKFKVVGYIRLTENKFTGVELKKLDFVEAVKRACRYSDDICVWVDPNDSSIICVG